jgi:VanZ family protein
LQILRRPVGGLATLLITLLQLECGPMADKLSGILKFWLPVALWLGWIFCASTDLMSAEHTSRFLGPFLRWWKPEITPDAIASIQLIVRKCAHLTEYAILAVLLWRAIRHQSQKLGSRFAFAAAITLLLTTVCAVIDEFHQSFVPSRMSSSRDVMIDVCGAFIGLVPCWWNQRHRLERPRIPAE